MSRAVARVALVVLAACLVAFVPGVSAAAAQDGLHVASIDTAVADASGASALVWLRADDGPAPHLPSFHVEAASLEGVSFSEKEIVGPTVPATAETESFAPRAPIPESGRSTPIAASQVVLDLIDAESDHEMLIRTVSLEHVEATAAVMDGSHLPLGDAYFSASTDSQTVGATRQGGIRGSDGSEQHDEPVDFYSTLVLPGQWVLGESDAGGWSLELRGDFIIETRRVDLAMRSAEGPGHLRSMTESEPLPGAPGATEPVSRMETTTFLRLELKDAFIQVTVPPIDAFLVQWLTQDLVLTPDGPTTLRDATGLTRLGGKEYRWDHDLVTLADLPAMRLVPQDGGERLAVHEADVPASDATAAGVTGGVLAPVGGAVMAMAVAIMLIHMAWRRWRAPLPLIERSIEAGRYHRAAQLAGRRLRRNAGDEQAAVARAVALSKAGRHGHVIEEVESRLREQGSSDGVLHYLLGMSYIKRGAHGEGIKSLNEAVRRTPSLKSAVADILPRRRMDAGGYA